MAFQHVALFFAIILVWHILANGQSAEHPFAPLNAPRRIFLEQPVRATRKVSQRAFQDMDLFTARGYGKRALDCSGGRLCAKRMPEFSGARLYGKRDIDATHFKCFFMDCSRLENSIRQMDYPNRKFRRNDEIVLPD